MNLGCGLGGGRWSVEELSYPMYLRHLQPWVEGGVVPIPLLRSVFAGTRGISPFGPAISIAFLACFASGEPFWPGGVARSSVPMPGDTDWLPFSP